MKKYKLHGFLLSVYILALILYQHFLMCPVAAGWLVAFSFTFAPSFILIMTFFLSLFPSLFSLLCVCVHILVSLLVSLYFLVLLFKELIRLGVFRSSFKDFLMSPLYLHGIKAATLTFMFKEHRQCKYLKKKNLISEKHLWNFETNFEFSQIIWQLFKCGRRLWAISRKRVFDCLNSGTRHR